MVSFGSSRRSHPRSHSKNQQGVYLQEEHRGTIIAGTAKPKTASKLSQAWPFSLITAPQPDPQCLMPLTVNRSLISNLYMCWFTVFWSSENSNNFTVWGIINPALYIRKQRLSEVKQLNQGHRVNKQPCWDLNPALLPYLFIFACVGSLLLCTGLLWLRRAGATPCCRGWASHCGGFSCCGAQAQGHTGFSSCGTQAHLPHGIWNLPGPGIKPMSLALAGKFLTPGPPGKSLFCF